MRKKSIFQKSEKISSCILTCIFLLAGCASTGSIESERGGMYFEQGNYAEAEMEFKKAVEKDDNNSAYYTNLGFAKYIQGKLEDASSDFQIAIGIDPKNEVAHINYGDTFRARGELDLAYNKYDEALRLNPLRYGTYIRILETTFDRGLSLQPLIEEFENQIAKAKSNGYPIARVFMLEDCILTALYLEGRYFECIDRASIDINVIAQIKKKESALVLQPQTPFITYIKDLPGSSNYMNTSPFKFWRGKSLYRIGKLDEAIQDFEASGEGSQNYLYLSRIFIEKHDYERAMENIQKSLKSRNLANSRMIYAALLKATGSVEEAEKQKRAALEIFNFQSNKNLKSFYYVVEVTAIADQLWGDFDSALTRYSDAIRRNPSIGQPYKRRAEILLAKGDTVEARDDIVKAITLMPYDQGVIALAHKLGVAVPQARAIKLN